MSIRWDSENDWENNQDSSGTTGRNGELKQGYSRERPELSTDLIGYWPLHDENATDYSGNDNHGSLNGGITTGVAGKAGLQAMSFDGNDDYIDVSGAENSSFPVTVCAWVKARGTGRVYSESTSSNSDNILGINIRGDPATASLYLRGQQGTPVISDSDKEVSGAWHHIVGVATSNELRIFVDGELENTESHSRPFPNVSNANIGRLLYGGGSISYFDGVIGECRTYDRALSSEEIKQLFEWGSGDFARPLGESDGGVAYYRFDGDAADSWSGINGSSSGGVVYSPGVRGSSVVLDGEDDDIEIVHEGDLAGFDELTVSCWIRQESFPTGDSAFSNAYRMRGGSNNNTYILQWDGRSDAELLQCSVTDSEGNLYRAEWSDYPQSEAWHHVVLSYEQSELRMFANSNLVARTSASGNPLEANSTDLYIGVNDGYGDRWQGRIDDLRIYNKSLTPEEVFELYRHGTRGRDMRKNLVNH